MGNKIGGEHDSRGYGGIAFGFRLLIGALFTVSGFLKLMSSPEEFALTMEGYRLLPISLLLPMARVLPWLEFLGGVYLFLGYGIRVSGSLLLGLAALFSAALSSALWRGLSLGECGCFGRNGPHLEPWQALGLDIFLMVGLALILLDKKRWGSLDRGLL